MDRMCLKLPAFGDSKERLAGIWVQARLEPTRSGLASVASRLLAEELRRLQALRATLLAEPGTAP